MKQAMYILLTFLAMAGCCKVYCDGTDLGVGFEKFKAADTDTVLFVNYLPGTGLAKAVDTFRILYQIPPGDTFRSSVSHSVSSSYDWKILLPSVNKQFLLENFELSSEKCVCGGQKYKAIKTFTINGKTKEGLFIVLE